jgi:hypothetical protein
MEKGKKEKGFLCWLGRGGIRPSRARARAAAWAGGPLGLPAGERRGDSVVGASPRASEEGRGLKGKCALGPFLSILVI